MDAPSSSDVFGFDRFRLDRRGARLLVRMRLEPAGAGRSRLAALDVLGVLVQRHGELVSRTAIMSAVWPATAIKEHNLTVQISMLRRVLDDGRTGGSSILTVPGRGYRFVLRPTGPEEGRADPPIVTPRLSIVVLPFENLSGEPNDDYLADAITDDLTSDLSLPSPDVSVIARKSADAYREQPEGICRIGEELRVPLRAQGEHTPSRLRPSGQCPTDFW